jgi:hypothetical protein
MILVAAFVIVAFGLILIAFTKATPNISTRRLTRASMFTGVHMPEPGNEPQREPDDDGIGMGMGIGIGLGVAIGAAFGAAFDHVALGVALGVGIGTALGLIFRKKS